jgi:hypothetical protein
MNNGKYRIHYYPKEPLPFFTNQGSGKFPEADGNFTMQDVRLCFMYLY